MALGQLLDQIRDFYLTRFVDAINDQEVAENNMLVHEPAFRDAKGNVATEGTLDLPARGDAFVVCDDQVVDSLQIDTEAMLSFEPLEFDWPDSGLLVELRAFQWNWLQLRIAGSWENADWEPLRKWFVDWFQEGDPPPDSLLGAVHFMSDPEIAEDYAEISIDLGSAPVAAFEGLMEAIASMGAERLLVGQFDEDE